MRSKSTFGKINIEEPMHYIAATHSSLVDSCKQWKVNPSPKRHFARALVRPHLFFKKDNQIKGVFIYSRQVNLQYFFIFP